MQVEPHDNRDDYRVWLSRDESKQLIEHLREEPTKQLAVRAMLHGLRSDELQWVRTDKIRRLESDLEAYKLEVSDGKTGFREVPIATKMKEQMTMMRNAHAKRAREPLIDVSKRTIRRWVGGDQQADGMAQEMAAKTGEPNWEWLNPHDLRRTWATNTFYALDSHYGVDIVMRWGGWVSRDVFVANYLGRETDPMAAHLMDQSGLR